MRILMVITILFLAVGVTSCEKEYTCQCKEVDTQTGKVNRRWNPMRSTFVSSSDATAWCKGNETSGFGMRIECQLQ